MPATKPALRPAIKLGVRLRVIGGVLLFLAFVAWSKVGDGHSFLDAWALASREFKTLVFIALLDVPRQIHYALGETSSTWWRLTQRAQTTWDARISRIHPWKRWRASVWAKRAFIIFSGGLLLSKLWHIPIGQTFTEAPKRIAEKLFSSGNELPLIVTFLLYAGMAVLQFVAIFWFLSRGGTDELSPSEVRTRFSNVWGQDHVVDRVKEAVSFLNAPETIENRGGYVPGGILLWGPPGTGKTLMAEAIAGESSRPYVFVDPGAFQAMFFGVGIMKVKRLFKRLRKLALQHGGVVVFFDEADTLGNRGQAVGGARTSNASEHTRWFSMGAQQALNSSESDEGEVRRGRLWNRVVMGMGGGTGELQILLSEISGLSKPRGFWGKTVRRLLGMPLKPAHKYRILSIFATNLPDVLDPALLRPGRIDRKYHVGYPNLDGRIRTYDGYFAKIAHDVTDEQIRKLAISTPYATGASIKDLVNEAVIQSVRRGANNVEWNDVLKAKQARELGESDAGEYIQRERYSVALHEACHAVAAYDTRRHLVVDIATIERRGAIGGLVGSIPAEERFTHWREEYEADLVVALASLAGEEMFFGQHTSGVGGDLRQATQLAEFMAGRWGMGDKLVSRGSDGTDRVDVSEINAILETARETAAEILKRRTNDVLSLVHALEKHRTLSGEDVIAVLEQRQGPVADGRVYTKKALRVLKKYHKAVVSSIQDGVDVSMAWPDDLS